MPQPTNYTPTTDFSQQEANNASGRSTVNTAALDAEFANIETTLEQTLANLQLIQRDDGRLNDLSCELHTLSPEVLNLIGGFRLTGFWQATTAYAVNDIASSGEYVYVCKTAHTSGAMFDAQYWVQFGFSGNSDAQQAAAAAQVSATNAATSASSAAASASTATTQASNAATSASNATASATTAATQASSAATSATNAANSVVTAQSAAANLPNATTAGGDKFLKTNSGGTAWEYQTAAQQRASLGAAAAGSVASSGITMNTGKGLGRTTAGSGPIEEVDRPFFSIKDFGAVGNGVADDTTPIQTAITAAQAAGGIVLVPKGTYRVNAGGINIANVTIKGCGVPEFGVPYTDNGSTILLDSTTTTPFILGLAWSITGLNFYYPNQDGTAVTPVVYPPLFTGTYVAGGVMNNCTVVNAYQVFKFTSGTAIGDLRFSQCRMYGINRVFWFLQGAPESINVSDCFFSHGVFVPASSPNTYLRDHTSASGEFCRIDVASSSWTSVDGFDLSNTLIYGYRYGIRVISGTLNVSTINNNWFDAVQTALSVENPGVIANTRWTDNYHYSYIPGGANSTASTLNFSASGGGGNLFVSGNDFVYSGGHHIYWNALSFMDVRITDNRFKNWGKDSVSAPTSYYAISATDAALNGSVALNKFQPSSGAVAHNRNGIGIGSAADVAVIGNEFDDCYLSAWIIAATRARIIGNTSTNTGFTSSFKSDAAAGVVQSSGNLWDKMPSGASGVSSFSANAGTQTFTGAKTQVTFTNAELFDRDNNFASSTFTAPTTDDYQFDVQLNNTTGLTAGDVWILSLEKAGSLSEIFASTVYVPANTALAAPLKCSARFKLTAGDTVIAYVTRSSGAGNYVTINNATYNTFTGGRVS